MEQIYEILLQSQKANQLAIDQVGRMPYPTLAVCVANEDPLNQRRIKVALPSSPQVESDWMRRLLPYPNIDPPLPTIGSTCLILFADGLETNGWYISLMNQINPPLDKKDAIKDLYKVVPGDNDVAIKGDDSRTVDGKITVNGGDIEITSEKDIEVQASEDFTVDTDKDISMTCDQKLTLFAQHYLRLQAGPSNYIQLGVNGESSVSGNWVFDLGGASLSFVNVGGFSINGKQVATENALDNDGDRIIDKGWA
ncbi:hypothetical protein AMR41_29490 [Hapalosiphon sp. MRB220]|nr:hypothetical protein AMR41_29490 [Hapalosiphon sp. MRB220]